MKDNKKQKKEKSVWRHFPLFLLAGLLCIPVTARCQIPFDFASTTLVSATNTKDPVIRAVNPLTAVASANGATSSSVYRIKTDPATGITIKRIDLEPRTFIHDLRVVDSVVYFCGQYAGEGCIGRISLSQFDSANSLAPCIKTSALSDTHTTFYRLAAYRHGGIDKVVAVGERIIRYQVAVTLPYSATPAAQTSHSVRRRIVAEVDCDAGSFNNWRFLFSDTAGINDCIWEPIVSDNYLALVGYYNNGNDNAISIHRCDKSNVIGSFSDWHLFPINTAEGASKFKGCHLDGDRIAIASLCPETPGNLDTSSSVVRIFDLDRKKNTMSARVKTYIKDEPKEIAFLPGPKKLVLLQNVQFLLPNFVRSAFVEMPTDATADYPAPCWFSAQDNQFASLDRLSPTQYAATDGSSLCSKLANRFNPAGLCYECRTVHVKIITNAAHRVPPTFVPTIYRTMQYYPINCNNTTQIDSTICSTPL